MEIRFTTLLHTVLNVLYIFLRGGMNVSLCSAPFTLGPSQRGRKMIPADLGWKDLVLREVLDCAVN